MAETQIDFELNNLKTSHIQSENNAYLTNGVLINLSDNAIEHESLTIKKYKSSIVTNIKLQIEDALFFEWGNVNAVEETTYSDPASIQNTWDHVYDVFKVDSLKDIQLWRSKQFSLGKTDVNLWFCPSNTHCGIHNEHDFNELHTQIFGLGIMQKFKDENYNSKYEDVLMPYGYTHSPFYKEDYNYPWHQYKSITDCIWVALEFDRQN